MPWPCIVSKEGDEYFSGEPYVRTLAGFKGERAVAGSSSFQAGNSIDDFIFGVSLTANRVSRPLTLSILMVMCSLGTKNTPRQKGIKRATSINMGHLQHSKSKHNGASVSFAEDAAKVLMNEAMM